MNKFTKAWQKKVRDYCDSQYEIIEVVPGEINFNFKCHRNATHFALKNEDEKLALVIYREAGEQLSCVHFVNYSGEEFIDNTLGHWCTIHEYRFIRWVSKNEFYNTNSILIDTQTVFKNMASPLQKCFGDVRN